MKRPWLALIALAGIGASTPATSPSWWAALAPKGEPGPPFVLEGRVLDSGKRPLQYRIRSVLPGIGEGSPHIHFRLTGPDGRYRVCTLFLCRSSGAGSDTTFARLPQMLNIDDQPVFEAGIADFYAYTWPDTAGVYRCTWDIPFDVVH